MQWCLFLIWAQGLRQAPLPASGAVVGRIVTAGTFLQRKATLSLYNVLTSTMATVTQVSWERLDQTLAIHHAELGWYIKPCFQERVVPGPGLGLTLQLLTTNDTGEYFCIYHTFPDGIYRERLFLAVLGSSVTEHHPGFQTPWFGAVAAVLVVICTAVIGVVAWARKKRSLRIHSAESGHRRMPSEQQDWRPRIPSPPGSCVQAEAAPADLYREQRENDYAEPHDYFNVLSYRSLESFSFPAETG